MAFIIKRIVLASNHRAIKPSHFFTRAKNTFYSNLIQSLFGLVLIIGLFGKILFYYDGLGRRIQTTSQGNTINYYYDPEVEFLELGHSVNGNRQWNLYGPDRSGVYGGAQGIGGLETCFTENTKSSFGIVNNYFGDVVGLMSGGHFTPYQSALGGYGPMPGSSVNQALQSQWRGHYLDPTGLVYMGARYYDPQTGRFISPDPLGHSSSLGLYDYCNGDPVNRLDPDGRCVEKIGAAGSIVASAAFGGPAGYVGVNYGTDRLGTTDTSSQTAQQQFEYNTQVASLTEATQETMFALAGARAPVNRISYEPMRFEVGEREPAVVEGEAYRAINPQFVEKTLQSGQFFKSGLPGRLGNDGIYVNSSKQGAINEFQFHNPDVTPAVFSVRYPLSAVLRINPPSGYFNQPLPFTDDFNILQSPSLRTPGTKNLLIREGAMLGRQLQ